MFTALGENVTIFPANYTGEQCMDIWMEEAQRYNFGKPGWQQGCNYFTQVVIINK
jgi:hypothetical protein